MTLLSGTVSGERVSGERASVLDDVTVVIPVWGSYWQYVPHLLATLIDEHVPHRRILVVANGESPPAWLPVSSVVSPERVSIGAARNLGLGSVDTRYVLFADADDLPVRGAIERLLETLRAAPDMDVATGQVLRTNGTIYPWPSPPGTRFPFSLPPMRAISQWAWNNLSLATGTVFRTDALKRIGGWPDMTLAEDGALACMLDQRRIVHLPQPTRVYRIHPQGLCQQGHPPSRWRQAYGQQRRVLAARSPSRLRALLPLYAVVHFLLAYRLSARARHTT